MGAHGGSLATVRPDDLAAVPIKALMERSGVNPAAIDDVVFGCTNQAGEDNRNIARMAALLAGLPVEIPGHTVNRLCASGLQAVAAAARTIKAGEGDIFIAGGVESMTRAPYVQLKASDSWDRRAPVIADTTVGWRFTNPRMAREWTISLGETAEIVAKRYGISREDQDAFAFSSQQKAEKARRDNVFLDEIVPVTVPRRKGDPLVFSVDEHPRPEVTEEKLARLRPAFLAGGTVTAGSSSGINDGSSALLIASESASDAGIQGAPMARIITSATVGVDPACMGIGPVPSTRKALAQAGLTMSDIDLVELNEAFAAQALACIKELEMDPARVNIYGGGIALGHPLGCTGARILTTLVHALARKKVRYGLATMCVGVGQGMTMIVERVPAKVEEE